MTFVKAVVEEVTAGPDAPKRVGRPFTVQLNPASLRLQMASTVDFGKDTGRQKVQYQGSTSTLSFDLVFDTADEGTTNAPVDVRSRTRQLERFVLPKRNETKSVPPRVRFTYGTFSVVGVMTALNQDFDLFAANGVPLRAKCAVTIKEQRPEFDAALVGPGANTGAGATPPVAPGPPGVPAAAGRGGVPGTGAGGAAPAAPPDRSATAVAGESAADFAARMGLDPRAWKTMSGIDDPLRLTPGQRIDFSTSPTPAQGLGAEQAAPAAFGATLTAAGVTAAGGLSRALDDQLARAAATAATAAAEAFEAGAPGRPAPTTSAAPGPPPAPASRPTGSAQAPASASASGSSVSSASAPLPVDARARTYGFGVPLRPRPGPLRASTGLVRRRASAGGADLGPWTTADPTVPRWQALRATPAGTGRTGCPCTGKASSCGCRP